MDTHIRGNAEGVGVRAIKFRAWDSYLKQMYSWSELGKMDEAGHLSLWNVLIGEAANITPAAYTGLKDKSGVEIYEGDIVGGWPHGSSIVCWNDEYACFESVGADDKENYGLFANELDSCGDAWEVIGNIYENPEMLDE